MPIRETGIAVAMAVGGLALLWGVWWLWWRLPKREAAKLALEIRDLKARADVEDNFRKTVGQALGGAAVLIGAVGAYLQFLQQQRSAHDLLISNQVSKGFEQLANDSSITMRLGGIYALEGVLNTSAQYRQPVLEALCAFLRDNTTDGAIEAPPKTDIQAALTVIARRSGGAGTPDLARGRFPRADLDHADLNGAILLDADLSGARMDSARLNAAKLIRTNFSHAFLAGAEFAGADLNGANLSGALLLVTYLEKADLSDAKLVGASLNAAYLKDARLHGTDLSRANLATVLGLTQSQLDDACGMPAALPPGLTPPKFPCPPEGPVAPQHSRKATP